MDHSHRTHGQELQNESPIRVAGTKLNNTQRAFRDVQQAEKSAAPPPAARNRPTSSQERHNQTTYDGQESFQKSAVPARAQTWNQEETSAPQQYREGAAARRAQVSHQDVPYSQTQGNSGSSSGRSHRDGPTSGRTQNPLEQPTSVQEHFLNNELQKNELRHQIRRNQENLERLQSKLKDSEVAKANLQQRFEEASETIFRLRPQRQECTESEIEEHYGKLIKSVQNWIDINCGIFLDDNGRGFGEFKPGPKPEPFEEIILDFESEAGQWMEAKEYILEALVMRYLIDRVLNKPFSILLSDSQRDFLVAVEKSMRTMEPRKDLLTIQTWKCDTVTAIDNSEGFRKRYPSIEKKILHDLFNFIGGVVDNQDGQSTSQSFCNEVLTPAITLAQKTQSATSIWTFEFSKYSEYQSNGYMYLVSSFQADVQDFRCINISNRKFLKPATDLATREQQEGLKYLLNVFPGLYCQRVTAGNCLPVSLISQPILLVAFDSNQDQARTQPENSKNHPNAGYERNENNQPVQPESEKNHPNAPYERNENNQSTKSESSTYQSNVRYQKNENDPPTQPERNHHRDQMQRQNHRSPDNRQPNLSDLSSTRPAGKNKKPPPPRPELKSRGFLQSAKNVLGLSD